MLLALMVVIQHLGGMLVFGAYAVFGFYTLSGFLMTLIMHKTYGYTGSGVRKYALNRFLRIYPPYWIACLFSVLLSLWLGNDYTAGFHDRIWLSGNLGDILQNIFILFRLESNPRLVPPSWALTVELFFYLCIALGLSKTKKITGLWFLCSVAYTMSVNVMNLEWRYKYFVIPAASLPFSTGALIYHFKEGILQRFRFLTSDKVSFVLFILIFANFFVSRELKLHRFRGFYINLILNGLLILSLIEKESFGLISKSIDKRLGALSYPMYLIHYQCGLIVSVIGLGIQRGQLMYAFVSLPLILFVSWSINRLIERPINRLRKTVKAHR